MTITEIVEAGGPVLWVILGCGVLALGVFLERALHLHRARIKGDDFLSGIVNNMKRGNVDEAMTLCKETAGPVAHIVHTAIQRRADDAGALREAIEDASRSEISRMERRLVAIATVAQLAPLLGLLGTILSLIEFLLTMRNELPLVESAHVMDAMMRALITTGAGLCVAIPAFAGFNILVLKIDRLVLDMQRAGAGIASFLNHDKPVR
jgi:biopolymer transport protein ExbB